MKLFYQIFLLVYPLVVRFFAFFNEKANKWVLGRKGIFRTLEEKLKDNQASVIWMHCASLGEFEQGRPVLALLKNRHPNHFILISFFSPSGYEVRKNFENANYVCYLPMDGPKNAKAFFDLVQPALVLFVKYEFWYFYSLEAANRKIPMLLVSGIFRASQTFFQFYGGFYRKILSHFSHIFVQERQSLQLLHHIGLNKTSSISGDTRFDRVITIAADVEPIPNITEFCKGKTVLVAGSTWTEDDEKLHQFLHKHPQVFAIIAPHDITQDRLDACLKLYPKAILYSRYLHEIQEGKSPSNIQVLIMDNYGMLTQLYHYAKICLVGGGFGREGVHNVLEAAVYGKPILIGPIYDKYLEVVELVERGGCISVENVMEMEQQLTRLLFEDQEVYQTASKAAKEYVYANGGATKTIVDYIEANRLLTN